MRPPFAQSRLSESPDGNIRLKLRKPSRSGQRVLVLSPEEFLRRLLAGVPPKRMNMVRYHGLFAPNAKLREAVVALVPPVQSELDSKVEKPASKADGEGDKKEEKTSPKGGVYRRPWHELIKRVWDLDILACALCGGRMNQISHIEDPAVIAKILGHLGLPTEPLPLAQARAPPQLDFGWNSDGPSEFDEPLGEDFAQ
jgi:hypothetical protein